MSEMKSMAAVEMLRVENERKTQMLAECFRLSGADPDGDADAMLAERAVVAVRELRKDYDENEDWRPRAERAEALLRQVLEILGRAHQTAMEQTLKARVPECGEFVGIAQDLDYVVTALRERLGEKT